MPFAVILAVLLSACSLPAPTVAITAATVTTAERVRDAPEIASPEAELDQRYEALHLAQPAARLFALDAGASSLRIHVFRAGRLAGLGHNHVLTAPRLIGRVLVPEKVNDAQLELAFRLDELAVDEPAQRASLGPAWASAMSPEAIAGTRKNMLGEAGLQAEAHPWVRIRSLHISGELPKLAMEVEIELHGQKRVQWLALDVQPGPDSLRAQGALVLHQSEFGVTPFSIGAGLLAVADELVVEFSLRAVVPGQRPIRNN
ncbi:YceI family protein [Paucibacter sp. hw1]|uniref:YceI family protein n=1 Tax=Roseateles koreensis TaxID=2987526 RepID=A0ABT5KLN2_9BURK|nr:YceI family protein [Roseateles koreensis]